MMFRHVLVPLDGSKLAEDVLGVVESLATHLGSKVTLLHVVERAAPERVHGQSHLTDAAAGRAYLEGVASKLRDRGIDVSTHVHERSVDDVAAAIDAHAHEYNVDLIAMCKHGRTGLRHRLAGSIAQQILQGGSIPILLRSPRDTGSPAPFELKQLLVPVDFEHDTDLVLEVAAEVARPYGACIDLMTAIPSLAEDRRDNAVARLLPGATMIALQMAREDAMEELDRRAVQLMQRGVQIQTRVREEDPATAILREAEEIDADVIVLATHARAGLDAWYVGSTGDRVAAGGNHTLLLLREL